MIFTLKTIEALHRFKNMMWCNNFRICMIIVIPEIIQVFSLMQLFKSIKNLQYLQCISGGRAEHQQACTHSPQSPPQSKGERTGRLGTTDEQRAKDTESSKASPQESGGQVHQMEDEIDICETDFAESMAILGFGEDDEEHTSFQ